MPFDYSGRNVVITGGTGALGTAVVAQLLEASARCHISCLDPKELKRFPYAAKVSIVEGVDLTDEPSVERFYGRLTEAGPLWASIHIAGGFAMGPIESTSKSDFLRQVNLNMLTCFLCCREAVRAFKTGGQGGRVVNVAARPGLIPELGAGMTAYTAAKAGVVALTQAAAAEVAGAEILVNAVVPSIMDTPANREAMPEADHERWPKVEEVARTILFLASPENRVTRGALVPVYGRT